MNVTEFLNENMKTNSTYATIKLYGKELPVWICRNDEGGYHCWPAVIEKKVTLKQQEEIRNNMKKFLGDRYKEVDDESMIVDGFYYRLTSKFTIREYLKEPIGDITLMSEPEILRKILSLQNKS